MFHPNAVLMLLKDWASANKLPLTQTYSKTISHTSTVMQILDWECLEQKHGQMRLGHLSVGTSAFLISIFKPASLQDGHFQHLN